jgi:hypothetical protein
MIGLFKDAIQFVLDHPAKSLEYFLAFLTFGGFVGSSIYKLFGLRVTIALCILSVAAAALTWKSIYDFGNSVISRQNDTQKDDQESRQVREKIAELEKKIETRNAEGGSQLKSEPQVQAPPPAARDAIPPQITPWPPVDAKPIEEIPFFSTPGPAGGTSSTAADEAAKAWTAVQTTKSTTVLEAFIQRYGDTIYGALAREKLASLSRTEVAAAAVPLKRADTSAAELVSLAAVRNVLPNDVPVNAETLRRVQTDALFTNAPQIRLAGYSLTLKKDPDFSSVRTYKARPIGRGLAEFEDSSKTPGRYSISNVSPSSDMEFVGVVAGNGLIDISLRSSQSIGWATTIKAVTQTQLDYADGTLFPMTVGNQFKFGTTTTLMNQNAPSRISEYNCRVAEKHAAAEFNRELTGDAFVLKCEFAGYPSGGTPQWGPSLVRWIFFTQLGYFLNGNSVFPDKAKGYRGVVSFALER